MFGGVFVWSIRMVQGCELYLRVKMYDCTMPLPRPRLYPCTLPIDISYMYREMKHETQYQVTNKK